MRRKAVNVTLNVNPLPLFFKASMLSAGFTGLPSYKVGVMSHVCNPRTLEAGTGGSPNVQV